MVIAWYDAQEEPELNKSEKVIRNYHGVRNEVHDKASGFKQEYKKVVLDGDIADMVDARRNEIGEA